MARHETGKKESRPNDKYKKYFQWAIVGCTALIIVAVVLIEVLGDNICKWFQVVLDVVMALAASGIAGLIVAIVVDTPQLVTNFKTMLTDALASNDYLEELPPERLEVIRKKVVGLIHCDSKRVPQSFLQLDDELCRLIDSPYYSYMFEQIVCSKKDNYAALIDEKKDQSKASSVRGDFFRKEVTLEFQINNPMNEKQATAEIGITKYMDLPDECELSDALVFKAFEVAIDDDETFDIRDHIIIERCPTQVKRGECDPNTMTYDVIVRMAVSENNTITKNNLKKLKGNSIRYESLKIDSRHQINVSFDNFVRVRIVYTQICPVADSHYTRRLKYSAKEYTLNYSCQNDYSLHGQIIGTLIKQSDMSIVKNGDNNLTLICRSWLLPKNGAFIVMDDVVKKN